MRSNSPSLLVKITKTSKKKTSRKYALLCIHVYRVQTREKFLDFTVFQTHLAFHLILWVEAPQTFPNRVAAFVTPALHSFVTVHRRRAVSGCWIGVVAKKVKPRLRRVGWCRFQAACSSRDDVATFSCSVTAFTDHWRAHRPTCTASNNQLPIYGTAYPRPFKFPTSFFCPFSCSNATLTPFSVPYLPLCFRLPVHFSFDLVRESNQMWPLSHSRNYETKEN